MLTASTVLTPRWRSPLAGSSVDIVITKPLGQELPFGPPLDLVFTGLAPQRNPLWICGCHILLPDFIEFHLAGVLLLLLRWPWIVPVRKIPTGWLCIGKQIRLCRERPYKHILSAFCMLVQPDAKSFSLRTPGLTCRHTPPFVHCRTQPGQQGNMQSAINTAIVNRILRARCPQLVRHS